MSIYPEWDALTAKIQEVDSSTESVLEVQRSLRSILSNLILCFVTALIVILINFSYHTWDWPRSFPILRNASPIWLAIIPLGILIESIRRYHDDLYVFGVERLTHRAGRLSLRYQVPKIKYSDIRAITVYQDLLGRLFDYGDIEIGTAAQEGSEIVIEGVRDPEGLSALIDNLRQYNITNVAAEDITPND